MTGVAVAAEVGTEDVKHENDIHHCPSLQTMMVMSTTTDRQCNVQRHQRRYCSEFAVNNDEDDGERDDVGNAGQRRDIVPSIQTWGPRQHVAAWKREQNCGRRDRRRINSNKVR